jgi:UDP-N-acetylglucosamine:LPS N-acetylglucosamine transferase
MSKPRVVFPYAEAGLGHMKPMESIATVFEKMYGDKVECVRSRFFTETKNKKLMRYEEKMRKDVSGNNKYPGRGFIETTAMYAVGCKVSTWSSVNLLELGAGKQGIAHMEELKPDLVFNTHFSTNWFATKCACKPLTVLYCPDIVVTPLYRYTSDIVMVANPMGYERVKKHHPHRFNESNLKRVNFLIRDEAFAVDNNKVAMRKKLGFDEKKFTVTLAEGGYGIGKMKAICEEVLKRDLPITLVPICGKNTELYNYFLTLKSKGNADFYPQGYTDNIFDYMVACDVFCGKSGANTIAEPTFFGRPTIVTKYASGIEKQIAHYYIKDVHCAIKCFSPKKTVDMIENFMANPALLQPYERAAWSIHKDYGAELCARYLFGLLCKRFPELADGTELY